MNGKLGRRGRRSNGPYTKCHAAGKSHTAISASAPGTAIDVQETDKTCRSGTESAPAILCVVSGNQGNGYLRQQSPDPENHLICFEFRRLGCITLVVLLPSERLWVHPATPIIDLLWLYDSPFRFRVGCERVPLS